MIHSLIIATKLSNFTKPRGRLLLRTLFRVSDLEVGIKNLSFYITELLQWVRLMVNTRAFRKNVAHWSHRSEKSNLQKKCCLLVSLLPIGLTHCNYKAVFVQRRDSFPDKYCKKSLNLFANLHLIHYSKKLVCYTNRRNSKTFPKKNVHHF